MREVSSDPDTMKGGAFHRLFQRVFPRYFKNNSAQMWQSFYTPAKNLVLAKEQNYLSQMDTSDLIIDSKNKGKAYRKLAKHDPISTEGKYYLLKLPGLRGLCPLLITATLRK